MRRSLHHVIYMKRDGDVQYSVLCVPGWGAAFHPTYISSVLIFIFGIAKKVRVYDVAVISKQVRAPLRAPHVRMHSNAPACLRCVSVFTQMHYTPGSELSGTPVAHLRTGQDQKKIHGNTLWFRWAWQSRPIKFTTFVIFTLGAVHTMKHWHFVNLGPEFLTIRRVTSL